MVRPLAFVTTLCLANYVASFQQFAPSFLNCRPTVRCDRASPLLIKTARHLKTATKCSLSEKELRVGVSDEVQNVGRGTLLSKNDAVKEVSVKVKGVFSFFVVPLR